MKLPFTEPEESSWRWMQVLSAKGEVGAAIRRTLRTRSRLGEALHRILSFGVQDDEYGCGVTEATTVCGVSPGRMTMPGLFSRLGAPRCPDCCRRLGIPAGDGIPRNSKGAVADPTEVAFPLTASRRRGTVSRAGAHGPGRPARQGRGRADVRRRRGPKTPRYEKPEDGDVVFVNRFAPPGSRPKPTYVVARNLVDVEVPAPARAGIAMLLELPGPRVNGVKRGDLVAWTASGPKDRAFVLEVFTNGQVTGQSSSGVASAKTFRAEVEAKADAILKEARWWAGRKRKKIVASLEQRGGAS